MELLEAVKKIESKYENLLSERNCRDIEVDVKVRFVNREYRIIQDFNMYFWNDKHGYDVEIISWDKDHDTNIFLKDCEQIFAFLENQSTLKKCDFKQEFPKYFQAKGFDVTKVYSISDEDQISLRLSRNSIEYNFDIKRYDSTETFLEPFEEYDEEVSPTDKIWEAIKEFESEFSNYIIDKLNQMGWTVKINLDVAKIALSKKQVSGSVLSYNILSYRNNLFESETKDIFNEIIYYLLKSDDPIKDLTNEKYHVVNNPNDKKSCYLFKKGEKFEIQYEYIKTSEYVGLADSGDIPKWFINFDDMDGHQFEHFCANVLSQNGFESVSVTSGSGDQGIDIIAYKDDIKYGIQCKCYHSDIGNKAVQEVYAGKTFYNCHVGIVLTNRDFTRSAIELAQNNGVILWNRTKLLQLIENCTDII